MAPRPQAAFAQEHGPQLIKESLFGTFANARNSENDQADVISLSNRLRDVTLRFGGCGILQRCEELLKLCEDGDDDNDRLEAYRYLNSIRKAIKQYFDIQEPRFLEKYDAKVAELQRAEADLKEDRSKRSLLPSSTNELEEMQKMFERNRERVERQLREYHRHATETMKMEHQAQLDDAEEDLKRSKGKLNLVVAELNSVKGNVSRLNKELSESNDQIGQLGKGLSSSDAKVAEAARDSLHGRSASTTELRRVTQELQESRSAHKYDRERLTSMKKNFAGELARLRKQLVEKQSRALLSGLRLV